MLITVTPGLVTVMLGVVMSILEREVTVVDMVPSLEMVSQMLAERDLKISQMNFELILFYEVAAAQAQAYAAAQNALAVQAGMNAQASALG